MSSTPTATSLAKRVSADARAVPAIGAVGDAELGNLLVELEAKPNALEAEQAMVMAEMRRRAAAAELASDAALASDSQPLVPAHKAQMTEIVSDEIAVLLFCSRMLAAHRLEIAICSAAHPSLMREWLRGSIDCRKVAVIVDGLRDVDATFADTLASEAACYAASRTATQTRVWLTRRVLAADPGMAEVRRARASEGRRVTLRPTADGMAELCALLPGIQARQAFDTINAVALAPRNGDTRTADQRRADGLMNLLTGRAEPPQVQIQVVVSADALAGESECPAWAQDLDPSPQMRPVIWPGGPVAQPPACSSPTPRPGH
ncbi:MAG: 13E12 repeat family protein [Actinomycetia bacterium]|nr:13E12 repeat family protein [Actinomycetes bacterium]